MKQLETYNSAERFGEGITADSLQQRFFPWPQFKVRRKIHKVGIRYESIGREATIIVLAGHLRLQGDDYLLIIMERQWSEYPEGCKEIEVIGEKDCEVVYVYDVAEIERQVEEEDERLCQEEQDDEVREGD